MCSSSTRPCVRARLVPRGPAAHRPARTRCCAALAPGSSIKPATAAVPALRAPVPADPRRRSPGPAPRTAGSRVARGLDDGSIAASRRRSSRGAALRRRCPSALTPAHAPAAPARQVEAIDEWGRALLAAHPEPCRTPPTTCCAAAAPRTRSRPSCRTPTASATSASAVVGSLLDLDRSYLAVQGPPGTGKTYLGLARDRRARARPRLEDRRRRAVARRGREHARRASWAPGSTRRSSARSAEAAARVDEAATAFTAARDTTASCCFALEHATAATSSAARRGTSPTRPASRAAASTCSSSTRPASSRSPPPSPSASPRATCCCSATRSSCRR